MSHPNPAIAALIAEQNHHSAKRRANAVSRFLVAFHEASHIVAACKYQSRGLWVSLPFNSLYGEVRHAALREDYEAEVSLAGTVADEVIFGHCGYAADDLLTCLASLSGKYGTSITPAFEQALLAANAKAEACVRSRIVEIQALIVELIGHAKRNPSQMNPVVRCVGLETGTLHPRPMAASLRSQYAQTPEAFMAEVRAVAGNASIAAHANELHRAICAGPSRDNVLAPPTAPNKKMDLRPVVRRLMGDRNALNDSLQGYC